MPTLNSRLAMEYSDTQHLQIVFENENNALKSLEFSYSRNNDRLKSWWQLCLVTHYHAHVLGTDYKLLYIPCAKDIVTDHLLNN